jgi:hypothetical protein
MGCWRPVLAEIIVKSEGRAASYLNSFALSWHFRVHLMLQAGRVQKLRRKVARGNRMKHVPALYLATAMAGQGMTKQELEALKLRI